MLLSRIFSLNLSILFQVSNVLFFEIRYFLHNEQRNIVCLFIFFVHYNIIYSCKHFIIYEL